MPPEPKQAKQVTPPYLSVAQLNKVIDLVSNRNLGTYSSALFRNYGLNDSDSILAFNTMRFLGLVDDVGESTPLLSKLRLQGDARKQEFEKIVRTAYKKLFDVMDEPQNLQNDELANEFVVQYNMTPRLASGAIRAFSRLCEIAGLKEPSQAAEKKPRNPTAPSRATHKSVNAAVQKNKKTQPDTPPVVDGLAPVSVAEGRLMLYIPTQLKDKLLDDENLTEDWSILRTAMKKFADTHIPKEEKSKPDTASGDGS